MEKKFIWYGLNKQFNDIVHSHAMTITDLLNENYPSWMALKNRGQNGNCDFLAECFFTGLKDKNGVDIYEGDIVIKKEEDLSILEQWAENDEKWLIPSYPFPLKEVNRDFVTLESFGYWLKNETFGYEGEGLQTPDYYEVIGNIYENPELLDVPTAVL